MDDEAKTKPMGVAGETETGERIAVIACGKCGALVRILGKVEKVKCPSCAGDVPAPR